MAETLAHVVLKCELYSDLRKEADISDMLSSGGDVFIHRREIWTWKQLHALRRLFTSIMETRRQYGRARNIHSKKDWQSYADELWSARF